MLAHKNGRQISNESLKIRVLTVLATEIKNLCIGSVYQPVAFTIGSVYQLRTFGWPCRTKSLKIQNAMKL